MTLHHTTTHMNTQEHIVDRSRDTAAPSVAKFLSFPIVGWWERAWHGGRHLFPTRFAICMCVCMSLCVCVFVCECLCVCIWVCVCVCACVCDRGESEREMSPPPSRLCFACACVCTRVCMKHSPVMQILLMTRTDGSKKFDSENGMFILCGKDP